MSPGICRGSSTVGTETVLHSASFIDELCIKVSNLLNLYCFGKVILFFRQNQINSKLL